MGYIKIWLGIIVVTNISLVSWLLSNYETSTMIKVISAIIAIIVLTICGTYTKGFKYMKIFISLSMINLILFPSL